MAAVKSDPREHVIYRGCTRPATYFGIPITPFILSVMGFALPGFWLLPIFGFTYAIIPWLAFFPVAALLRLASRKDPYTLIQVGMRLRMRIAQRNKARWSAVTFSPFRYTR